MRVTLVFCEGRHDVAFIQKSLTELHKCTYRKSLVGELPSPLNKQVAQAYAHPPTSDRHISTAELPPFPVFDVDLESPSGDRYILVRCGSNQQKNVIVRFLEDLDLALRVMPPGTNDVDAYAVAFLYDADEIGVEKRVGVFQDSFAEHFGSLRGLTGDNWVPTKTVPVGCFVFCQPETGTGALEDWLAPMVECFEPERWQQAIRFIDDNKRPDDRVCKSSGQRWKAIIAATAQFQFPGNPMSTLLTHKKGIPSDAFDSEICKSVVQFLTSAPW